MFGWTLHVISESRFLTLYFPIETALLLQGSVPSSDPTAGPLAWASPQLHDDPPPWCDLGEVVRSVRRKAKEVFCCPKTTRLLFWTRYPYWSMSTVAVFRVFDVLSIQGCGSGYKCHGRRMASLRVCLYTIEQALFLLQTGISRYIYFQPKQSTFTSWAALR